MATVSFSACYAIIEQFEPLWPWFADMPLLVAVGILPVKLSHAEVTETANRVSAKFRKVIDLILTVV